MPAEERKRLLIGNDEELTKKANVLADEALLKYVQDHSLHSSRIQCLKVATVPLWIFSSFAIRNVLSSELCFLPLDTYCSRLRARHAGRAVAERLRERRPLLRAARLRGRAGLPEPLRR